MVNSKKQRRALALEKRRRTLALKAAKAWNESSSAPAMSTARSGHAVCAVGSKIFAIGGRVGKSKSKQAQMEVLDTHHPDSGWQQLNGRNLGKRRGLGVAVVGTKIYAVGGAGGNNATLGTVAVFDTTQPTKPWRVLSQKLNVPRAYHGVCVVGTKIYVVGGCRWRSFGVLSDGDAGRPEVFDTEHPEEGWTYQPTDLKTRKRDGLCLASVGTKLYALGGYVRGKQWDPSPSVFTPKPTVEWYDTANPDQGWQEFPRMCSNRKFFAVGVLGTKMYAIGGHTGSQPRPYVEVCDTAQYPTGQWKMMEDQMTYDRMNFGVAVVGEKMYAVGGSCGPSVLDNMEVKNTAIRDYTDIEGNGEGAGEEGEEKRQRLA